VSRKAVLAGAGLLLLLMLSVSVSAESTVPRWETSVSLAFGLSVPNTTDFTSNDPSRSLNAKSLGVRLDNSFAFGNKFTRWFTGTRERLGLDVGWELQYLFFDPDLKAQTRPSTGITGGLPANRFIVSRELDIAALNWGINLVVARPIGVTDDLPFGRFRPYLGVGPALSFASFEGRDGSTALGFQALAGANFFLGRRFSLFAEYQFSHAHHTFDCAGLSEGLNINANHFLFGFTFQIPERASSFNVQPAHED
jgi:opacity protein-like surface antigen